MGPGSLRAAGDASSLRLLLFWDSHPAHPQGHPRRWLQTWVRSCHHLPHQWPRMCWQQLPALLAPLGIPHTLGTLAMPPAWAQPWAPPLRGWGPAVGAQPPALLPRCFGGASHSSLPAMLHCGPFLSLTTCPRLGKAGAPSQPPPLAPSPAGCRNACAWKAMPGSGCLGTGKPDPWERGPRAGDIPGLQLVPRPLCLLALTGQLRPCPRPPPQEWILGVWELLSPVRSHPWPCCDQQLLATPCCHLLAWISVTSWPAATMGWGRHGDQLPLCASSWASRLAAGTAQWQFQGCQSHPPRQPSLSPLSTSARGRSGLVVRSMPGALPLPHGSRGKLRH